MKKQKILLAITFFNRFQTLKIIENYYKDKDVDIVLIDQSFQRRIFNTNLKNVKSIEYFSAKTTTFYEMWLKIIEKYHDRYSHIIWNCDDDFTPAGSIHEIEKFINEDASAKNYSVITGQVVQVDNGLNFIKNYATSEYQKEDIKDKSVECRIEKIFCGNGVHVNPHAVFKISVLKTCCELILKTKDTNYSLLPIRFFDKILTLVAAAMGHRKTNFNNITSIRTARSFTGSTLKLQDSDYPAHLEKNTDYVEIFNRLKNKNVLSGFFKIDETLLFKCLDINNFISGKIDESKLDQLPIYSLYGKEKLKEVYDAFTLR